MEIIELVIKEDADGIEAISVVENPAIEVDFIALSKQEEIKLAEVDKEKRILMGAALIPNKQIYRKDKDKEYYIYFSEDTVRKASELYLKESNQSNATLEHKDKLVGLTVVESWIVEDEKKDKSNLYELNAPKGSWVVSMKVDNDDIWNDYVKTGKVKGFSIEGFFTDKVEMSQDEEYYEELATYYDLEDILTELAETYNDYPESASNNAKKVLKWRDEHGDEVKGMTQVGWTRANQLAKKENISRSTIARMASFKRHEKNAEVGAENKSTPWKDAGYVAWLGWGGTSGINWAINKLKTIDK